MCLVAPIHPPPLQAPQKQSPAGVPPTVIEPESANTIPDTILTNVLLPDPFPRQSMRLPVPNGERCSPPAPEFHQTIF